MDKMRFYGDYLALFIGIDVLGIRVLVGYKDLEVRKQSERIMKKNAFSRFKNNPSDPVMIDMDDDFVNYKQPEKLTKVKPTTTHEQVTKKATDPVIDLVSPVFLGSDRTNKVSNSNIVHELRTKQRSDPVINLDSPVVLGSAKSSNDANSNKTGELRTKRLKDTAKHIESPVVLESGTSDKGKKENTVTPDTVYYTRSSKRKDKRKIDYVEQRPLQQKKRMKEKEVEGVGLGNRDKIAKKKSRKKKVGLKIPSHVPKIQLRTSPNVLYTAMKNLSPTQKKYVESIGLGVLLRMQVDGSPTRIGYYAAKNFDPQKMVMSLDNRGIEINKRVVHDMLGLPMVGVDIDSMDNRIPRDKTVEIWKDQFKLDNDIHPKAVQKALNRST